MHTSGYWLTPHFVMRTAQDRGQRKEGNGESDLMKHEIYLITTEILISYLTGRDMLFREHFIVVYSQNHGKHVSQYAV